MEKESTDIRIALNPHLSVVSYTGGANAPELTVKNCLDNESQFPHCTQDGSNFDLVLKSDSKFRLTNILLRGPENCTAPIKTAVFFISDTLVDMKSRAKYDNLTSERWNAIPAEVKQQDGAIGCLETVFDVDSMDVSADDLQVQQELPAWPEGQYLHVKIVRAHDTGMGDHNIDVGFLGFAGFFPAQTSVPAHPRSLGEVPKDIGLTVKGLEAFNILQDSMGKFFSFGSPLLVLWSGEHTDIKVCPSI